MATTKRPAPIRMGEEGLALIRAVAANLGVSQASAVEIMVREYARMKGIRAADAPSRSPRGNAGKIPAEK